MKSMKHQSRVLIFCSVFQPKDRKTHTPLGSHKYAVLGCIQQLRARLLLPNDLKCNRLDMLQELVPKTK